METTLREQEIISKAKEKWLNKNIEGPKGKFFVNIVYLRTHKGEDWLEALVFPLGPNGSPCTLKLVDMRDNYKIFEK